jgi:hypothetical protein
MFAKIELTHQGLQSNFGQANFPEGLLHFRQELRQCSEIQ